MRVWRRGEVGGGGGGVVLDLCYTNDFSKRLVMCAKYMYVGEGGRGGAGIMPHQ